jgi:hypothetical protein
VSPAAQAAGMVHGSYESGGLVVVERSLVVH